MKKTFLWLTLSCLLALTLFLCACGETESTGEGGTPESEPELVVFMTDGASEYTVISPFLYSSKAEGKEAVERFQNMVQENSGTPFSYASDRAEAGDFEILLGETNRPESEEAAANLRENDYIICVRNNKLIAVGGSLASSCEAIVRLGKMFFSQPQTSLILYEGVVYQHLADYAIEDATIGDVPLRSYTLTYDANSETDALQVADDLGRLYGWTLPAAKEDGTVDKKIFFTVGGGADQWSITLKEGVLTVQGGSAKMLSYACAKLKDLFRGKEKNLAEGFTASGNFEDGASLRVFDLNVYFSGYGESAPVNRYPRLMTQISENNPDILTLQDVSPTWLSLMKEGTENALPLTDTYDYVGVGRNNDDKSVMHPIFYKKSRFTLKDSGAFWLSETPQWESVGWDGYARCICTWAILTDRETGLDFAVMNTQYDPHGKNAQTGGGALVAKRAQEFDLPVIFGGDFQATSLGNAYRGMGSFLVDAVTLSEREGDASKVTRNKAPFGESMTVNRATDFVMVSRGDFRVCSHTTLTDLVDGAFVSSHWAIVVDLVLRR